MREDETQNDPGADGEPLFHDTLPHGIGLSGIEAAGATLDAAIESVNRWRLPAASRRPIAARDGLVL
jgi:hypothetical protein